MATPTAPTDAPPSSTEKPTPTEAARAEPDDDPEPVPANRFESLTIDEKVKHLKARADWASRQFAKLNA